MVRDHEGELQEQLNFLSNEKDNLTELERQLAEMERKARGQCYKTFCHRNLLMFQIS